MTAKNNPKRDLLGELKRDAQDVQDALRYFVSSCNHPDWYRDVTILMLLELKLELADLKLVLARTRSCTEGDAESIWKE